jgi:phage baseplate assembly protein V
VNKLLNAMKLQAMMALAAQSTTRLGTVEAYNPNDYTVKVSIQPEGVTTGWLPLASPWVGSGWGMFSPPALGDMLTVEFQEGNPEAGVAMLRLFNDQDRPLTVDAGELWLVHKSGAFFKLTNDGAATFSDGQGATVKLGGDGTITSQATAWVHTGPLTVKGAATVTGQLVGQGGMAISGGTAGSSATIQGSVIVSGGDVTVDGIGVKSHHHVEHDGYSTNQASA